MSIRIADEAGSTDGHAVVGSPTATNGPHPFQPHPAQPPLSVSTSNPPNVTIPSRPSLSSKSSSSPPRSSTDVDFVGKSSPPSATARWRNSLAATQRTDVASSAQSDSPTVVEPGFDESVLRALCDLDVSVMPPRLYHTQPTQSHQVRGTFIT